MAHHAVGGPTHGKYWTLHSGGSRISRGGGGISKGGGKKPIILALFLENCMKLRKKLDRRRSGYSAPPLGSATALYSSKELRQFWLLTS